MAMGSEFILECDILNADTFTSRGEAQIDALRPACDFDLLRREMLDRFACYSKEPFTAFTAVGLYLALLDM